MTERLQAPRDVQAQLALLEQNLTYEYPNYPLRVQRLVVPVGQLALGGCLPQGPWEYSSGKAGELAPEERPLHPWLPYMIGDENIGVVTGSGAYWYWGTNHTADAIVMHENNVLLARRRDTGLWALPGGHVNPGEDSEIAAIRELHEEAGILVTPDDAVGVVYKGPVADPRMTANAWPETTAVLYKLTVLQQAHADDDVDKVAWVDIESALDRPLFGSHSFLLQEALKLQTP